MRVAHSQHNHDKLTNKTKQQADALAAFMLPMLEYMPDKRATAAEMLAHPWLAGSGNGAVASGAGTGCGGTGAPAPHSGPRSAAPSPPAVEARAGAAVVNGDGGHGGSV